MIYRVQIGYMEMDFNDAYRAIEFATTAKMRLVEDKTVEIEIIKEETDG